MTFNALSEDEARLYRVQERCAPCPKAGREKVAHRFDERDLETEETVMAFSAT
jgi:hypothetical protein